MPHLIKRKHILLVDGENLLHQSFHRFENLKSSDGKPSGAIFGFFKSLHGYLDRFAPDRLVITFDNGHSPYRTELWPHYKGHRLNISIDYESLHKQKAVIMKILRYLRIIYIYDKYNYTKYEGDDFLAYLALKVYGDPKKYKVTLVSTDKDFNQLIDKHLKVYHQIKDQMVRLENCKELVGYTPDECSQWLSIIGDASDDIPGYKGLGPVGTRKFLDHFGSIDNYLNSKEDWPKVDKELMAKTWERNKQLIDLKWFINHVPLKLTDLPMKLSKKPINWNKFKSIALDYTLNSFLSNMFITTYKEQYERSTK